MISFRLQKTAKSRTEMRRQREAEVMKTIIYTSHLLLSLLLYHFTVEFQILEPLI